MPRVLLVDDDPHILRVLSVILRAARHEVQTATDGVSALACIAQQHPDLVILDLGLPDIDGTEVIRRLREWTTVPIIVLSGRAGGDNETVALDVGADDYITKPFATAELQARIRAALRRGALGDAAASGANLSRHRIGHWMVDLIDHTVIRIPPSATTAIDTGGSGISDRKVTSSSRPAAELTTGDVGARPTAAEPAGIDTGASGDDRVHLTPTEWRMLTVLLRRPGRLVESRALLNEVWGEGHDTATHYLRIYMSQLRAKLEPVPSQPRHLLTDPGLGYRYQL